MRKIVFLLVAMFIFSMANSNNESAPDKGESNYNFPVNLTITGEETSCGVIGIYIYQKYNGLYYPVGSTLYPVDGTGNFNVPVPGINSCGQMKIICKYIPREGYVLCDANLNGYSSVEFIRSCNENPPIPATIYISNAPSSE